MIRTPPSRMPLVIPSPSNTANRPNVLIAMPKPEALPPKTQSLDQRIAFVEQSVSNSQQIFQKLEQQSGPKQKIYIGPEYMFDNETGSQQKRSHAYKDTVRHLNEPEYRHVNTKMLELSKRFPDIIIKPGTTAWQKPVERPTTEAGYLQAKGASDPSHPLHSHYKEKFAQKNIVNDQTAPGSRTQKAVQANSNANQKFPTGNVRDVSPGVTHLARNTADTYFNGERISHHHKITDYHEVNMMRPGELSQHYAGKDFQGRHTLPGNILATQEICLDHVLNATEKAGTAHFIHSDWTNAKHTLDKYQDSTTFVAHASTRNHGPDDNRQNVRVQDVSRVENGQLTSLKPVMQGDKVSIYDLQGSNAYSTSKLEAPKDNTSFEAMGFGNPVNSDEEDGKPSCVVS